MTYTRSQAIAGRGSSLSIGSSPTLLGEIKESSPSGNAWQYEDVTNFQSGADQEFISTIRNNGEFRVQGNYVATDAGQVAVETAYGSGAISAFVLQLPLQGSQTVMGNKYSFNAYIMARQFTVQVDKAIAWDVTLKVSGPVTFTAGS